MFSGPCLVFCLALATGPSTASGQQTDRDFISVQTPFDEVEVTEASAFVKVMPWKDGEGVCTVIVSGGRGFLQAGAGIVADSVPEREYQETLNKARGLTRAIHLAARA